MKKKAPDRYFLPGFLRKMLAAVFLLFIVSLSYAAADNDTKLITFAVKSENLNDVLIKFKDQTGVDILFNKQLIGNRKCNDFEVVNQPIEVVLSKILEGTGFVFSKADGVYVIKKSTEKTVQSVEPLSISGVVTDTDGIPLPGVTVLVKGTSLGSATDTEGKFKLSFPSQENVVLVFSFVGMQTKEVPYKGESEIKVTLQTDVTEMEQVVVTGIFTRKAESYTGAATTIKKEELQKMGNQNVLQSLKSLDPAFHIIENNDFGSDPNKAPQIQLRGQQSMPDIKGTYNGNPNQPLFILDGFETDITTVYDLDMNRVASVTLLKDAAAKAIYGSRAANGVVVIETIQPEKGKLKVSYTGDLTVTAPDLTSYDLCDATEKLEVERTAGRYKGHFPVDAQWLAEEYNVLKKEVERGVNTYWLGFGHKHSLYLEGGDDYLRYGVDLSYNKVAGVMKGSDRETVSGAITLSYRYKSLLFRNVLSTTFNRADDSPYGSFSEYTKLNPYWTSEDENGNVKQVLGSYSQREWQEATKYYNPLYNAMLGTKNFAKYTEVTDNFYVEWQMYKDLKFIGRFGYTQKQDSREDFYPGSHTRFAEWTGDRYFQRGSYYMKDGVTKTLKVDATLNYSKQWDKHLLFANLNWNMQQNSYEWHSMEAWGFLNNKVDHVAFAKQYAENGRPGGDEETTREVGVVGAVNYSYDNRYLADLSYRLSGSSIYGSDNRWGGFWSAGVGWNLHHEAFLKEAEWLRQFKLRASVGYTGSQNFNPYQAMATYKYFTDAEYDNIVGAYLMGMANDKLKWQQTRDVNVGFDVQLLKGMTVRFDYYVSNTDNLLVDFDLSGSTGFNTFKENLGEVQNRGFDATINWRVYENTKNDAYVTLFGSVSSNKNEIKKISDALSKSNDEQIDDEGNPLSTKPYTRFEEGQSTSAIWAVRSLGIDPASGEEMFIDRNGYRTYVWNVNDQVVCGEANPKFQGNFGFNAEWRGLAVNCLFAYKAGGEYYNQTLVDRVENVDVQWNVDRRVFTGTWKEPGDRTFFKRVESTPTQTYPTSRFVEKSNELSLSSLNVSYDFKRLNVKRYVERLKIAFYMTDVFRVSTVKAERGLEYPFARTCSFSLQATF